MDPDVGASKFRESKRCFEAARFGEALTLLDSLNEAFPNTQNVLYLSALCLEELGRDDEALTICRQLAREYSDTRAMELIQRITSPVGGAFEELLL